MGSRRSQSINSDNFLLVFDIEILKLKEYGPKRFFGKISSS